ncbi:hypothetical protein HKBW3S42_01929 [Candidatus Hakubella thermalkaliphila]|uniref:Uncharacterized protein n=1 Tax=Candidatus Hakubella thermalkaliphila TaxID=2754717 RepID=A0A6V8PLS2_9ACTN|nr:hypothetical protein HKBW3S42_01929 [Candidatus Hakubella thermalkaliphila]
MIFKVVFQIPYDDDTWNEDWANELRVETQLLKSITAKQIFSRFPRFRHEEWWGGELGSDGNTEGEWEMQQRKK